MALQRHGASIMSGRMPYLACRPPLWGSRMTPTRLMKGLVLFGFLPAATAAAQDKKIDGVGPAGPIKKPQSGFKFTEGPISDAEGNLFFSDIPNEKIHKLDASGQISVFRDKSNSANGLMVNAKGEIIACEMAG